jgi:hypothetical protein
MVTLKVIRILQKIAGNFIGNIRSNLPEREILTVNKIVYWGSL